MKTIKNYQLKELLEKNEVVLIDVREPAEHKIEWIEGAYLIPHHKIKIENLPLTQKPIVLYCRSGKRSADTCIMLLNLKPNLDIYSLEGGITQWIQNGFKVQQSGIIPIERQTQIAAGFIVFFGTILGSVLHSAFYIVPALIGAGLIFAGLSGWCGMAKLLAIMPWNK